ncbi:MAG: cytochrome c biogenesis protein CcsA [Candidatus Thalassarchaeaceae archaeon]|nr:cytochrome c biogenesis protein CcsA [Candidatus Thalassarchaeaceae archaeon]
MRDYGNSALIITVVGLACAAITAFLGFFHAPLVDPESWNAPEAYRILYWHVPFAWSSFLSFCLLFCGAFSWYVKRSERGWRAVVISSELGLLFGLGVLISGPIWGSVEWGVPWDWGDVRLNTFALLTSVALFLVMSLRSQPDGEETRDTLAAVGLFGFILVPITATATTIWRNRHPGVILRESEETGVDPEILQVMIFGATSFMILFIGLVLLNYSIYSQREVLEELNREIDKGGMK